ncbi:alpha/beta hydrolase [Filobacillus milosensis]|uniref:Alpha/beta hydrolase n=1 Tax=Filobacillus milosensis TaxID=94137 RepID=A0A4Y8IJN4_9BACI|nr:alpha/beta hydrolase [Filobacillus milosensis]TFB19514.1 alpha/beta hydrolase [Filobacillus milosensis]
MRRSVCSWLFERFLLMRGTKKRYSNKDLFAQFMNEKSVENAKAYVIPENLLKKYKLQHQEIDGANVYYFNRHTSKDHKHIIYLHGGAYVNNPLGFHWAFLDQIHEATGAAITVPVYLKAPNYTYERSFELVLTIYKNLLEEYNPNQIIIMGDSAGGGMGLAFAQWLQELELPQPGQLILLSPWLDITMTNPDLHTLERKDPMLAIYGTSEMGKTWAGDTNVTHYKLSPINGSLRDLGGISIFVGTHELLLADARLLLKKAKEQDVAINYFEYPRMNHCFPVFPIPEAKDATRKIIGLIQEDVNGPKTTGLFANVDV